LDRDELQAAIGMPWRISEHDTRLLMLVATLGMGSVLLGVNGVQPFAGKAGQLPVAPGEWLSPGSLRSFLE